MSHAPTIAAVASGWGHSRHGLVRLSGPATPGLLAELCRPAPTQPRTIAATGFRLTDTLELPALVLRYDAPHSFTGEHAAEFIVPGNPLVLERVLARLASFTHGFVREAQPGEFSARAYLNGKLSLNQAEGVAATIAAQTESQLVAAALLLSGQTGHGYRAWGDRLATMLALVEAGIDFTDQEDVVPIAPADLAARLADLLAAIHTHLGAGRGMEQTTHTPRAVLIGPPNAGKSTLFNALLGRRRAVESPVAGTTRDALVELLDLSRDAPDTGATISLIDLPGLDPAPAGTIDTQAQARARDEIGRADIRVLCDPRGRFDFALPASPRPTIRVRTMADLPEADEPRAHRPAPPSHAATASPPASSRRFAPGSSSSSSAIPICALDGWNLRILRRALADAACAGGDASGPFLLPRHRRALAAAAHHLTAATALVDPTARALAHPETIATDLRTGLNSLAELTGDMSPDDIIGRIFATFCVGK